jgi:hypothetical protein
VPPVRVRLTVAKTGLRRHRKLRLARPSGLGLNLDSGRRSPPRPTPRAWTQPRLRKTVSTSPDPLGSYSTSTPEDGLRLARPPGARTQPRPRTTVSASPDPRAWTQPRPRTMVSTSPDPRGSDSTSTSDDGLRLARPSGPDSASTSEEPPPRPTSGSDRPRHRGGHHYPTPS